MGTRVVATLAVAVVGALASAGSAAGAVRSGSGTDPVGDATSGVAEHDAVAFVATYDPVSSSAPRRAALALTTAAPRAVPRARWVRVRVHIANTGSAPARGVRLHVGRARGVAIRPRLVRVRRAIRPGGRASATLRVRLSRAARTTTTLALRVRGSGRLAASGRLVLRSRRRAGHAPRQTRGPGRRPGTGAPGRNGATLAGRWFWRFETGVDTGWVNDGIAFLDDRWAYRGLPRGGLPRCARATARADGDGCVAYRFDARTGRLVVGGVAGSYRGGRLRIGEHGDYRPLFVPRPGARYQVALHHQNFRGYCGLITGCTTWEESLTLTRDGRFALRSESTSTLGGSGTPFTAVWSAPPDERGTYAIEAGARLRLSYADGRVVRKTIGIEYGRDGRPDPAGTGLLLDDVNFYPDDE